MHVVFAGTPEAALPSLEALLVSRHSVVAVLTRPDAPSGRGRRLSPSPVARRAHAAGIDVLTPGTPRDDAFLETLRALAPDCCPVVAYGALIPPAALDVPLHGWVNLHFSLLPAWRGAAPVHHAILRGDEVTGASTFRIEEGLDTGPVYGCVTETIKPADTAGDLLGRLADAGARLLVATLDGIEDGTLTPRGQPGEGVTPAPKVTTEDARVEWSSPALHLDRLVRACSPAPGAWTTFRGERLKLAPVRLLPDVPGLAPGQVAADRSGVLVGTGSHAVALTEVQPVGRRMMPARDWANGVRLAPGELMT
ncbi:MAG: methionyl-tRNA formyltransferase [Streptomycetales bacterium]